jgi:hypothetical protein
MCDLAQGNAAIVVRIPTPTFTLVTTAGSLEPMQP